MAALKKQPAGGGRRRRRVLLLASGLLVAGGAIAGGAWWRAEQRGATIAAMLPAEPDTGGWPVEFRERLEMAALRARKGSIEGLGELSGLYHANGFLEEAQACYRTLERIDPAEPRWWHRHAAILAGFGELDAALVRTERVLALAPDYRPARLRLGELQLKRNEPARAAAIYAAVLREGEDPHALFALARMDVEAGRWEEARQRLERVVAMTDYALGYDLIVTVYERLGQPEAAARVRGRTKASGAYRDPADPWLDELIGLCFDAYRLSLAAGLARSRGDLDTAQRMLERAVTLAPADVPVRFQWAGVLVEKRDLARAREQLERCTADAPDFPDAWAHLAALHEQAGDPAGAERVLAAGMARCPDSPGLHLMRARQHRRAGRAPAAVESYRRSIHLRPNEAEAAVELATLLVQMKRTNDAAAHLLHALEAEPDHPTALSLLALMAIAAGDEAGAQRWIARVRAQPRIAPAEAARIFAAYRGQFGREAP